MITSFGGQQMKKVIAALFLAFVIIVEIFGGYIATVYAEEGAVRKSLQVNKTLTPPKIDGMPDESMWDLSVPVNVALGRGFEDTEAKFGMLWDNTYIYIAVKVKEKDKDFVNSSNGTTDYWFDQDSISMFFDPTTHQSSPFVDSDMQVGFVYRPYGSTPEFHFGSALNGHEGKDEKKILRAMQRKEDQWTCEVAVPWDMLSFDPNLTKSLGFELMVTDRDSDGSKLSQAWSAYNSSSFYNDTSGYGRIYLSDTTVKDPSVSDVLLEEDFESYDAGGIPADWMPDASGVSSGFKVEKSFYEGTENSSLVFDGSAPGKEAGIYLPVQWDNYTVTADIRFDEVLNNSGWAAIMFRAPVDGKYPYNFMALRYSGAWEIIHRDKKDGWTPLHKGTLKGKNLKMKLKHQVYTMKVRVFDRNVKAYFKKKEDAKFDILADYTFKEGNLPEILERGGIGFRGGECRVAFDNVVVTRLLATDINWNIPSTLEALTGPIAPKFTADFSDGIRGESVPAENVKIYSSDENIIKVVDGSLYPLKAGKCKIRLVYFNAEREVNMTVTPSSKGAKVISISHEDGYILGTKGMSIDASKIKFEAVYNDFSKREVTGDNCKWSFADPSIARYSKGSIKILAPGMTTATVTKDGVSTELLLITRESSKAAYVLYEEDFGNLPDGKVPDGWSKPEGSSVSKVGVNSGAFEIDAKTPDDNPVRILLPEYLSRFGQYAVEADVTTLDANAWSSWNSVMFGVQGNSYPYYFMAVRKGTATFNGVELVGKDSADDWNTIKLSAYTKPLEKNTRYHYTLKVYGNRAQGSIDNKVLIDTELADSSLAGRIGFQVKGEHVRIDNIKITLLEKEFPAAVVPEDNYARVTEPDTKIAAAPSIVAEIGSFDDFKDVVLRGAAATAIMNVNKKLEVLGNGAGSVIGTVDKMYKEMKAKVIPAFRVGDADTVDAVIAYLEDNEIEDAFIISRHPELIKRAREKYPIVRGVLEFPDVSGEASTDDLVAIRDTTNGSLARVAVIPAEAASKDNVQFLQQRLVVVWVKEERAKDSSDNRVVDLHKIVTAGANGIVTTAPEKAKAVLETYNHNITIVRKPFLIGHRGVPDLAPENTIEGSELAFRLGADMVENDIWPTKAGADGQRHLVVMHDPTIDRTTNGSGVVPEMTLEKLKAYFANKQFPQKYPSSKIPTLDQYFENFTQKGKMLFVEIKSPDPVTADLYTKLIKKMGEETKKNLVTISFYRDQLTRVAEQVPEMPTGWLCSGIVRGSDLYGSLRNALLSVQPLNSAFSTSYAGVGKEFIEAAKHRGLVISPWTFTDKDTIVKYFKLGVFGLTTNCAEYFSDWAINIRPAKDQVTMRKGESTQLFANVETYKGSISEVTPDIVVLSGGDNIVVDGNRITPKKAGEAFVTLRYTARLTDKETYDIYTQPVKIQIQEDTAEGYK